ncbi:hypothetical protein [Gracilibacillus lacisalsi]|uniref:hypothetical protein n=1 Tax=Gracilibacillus lacisalsi TaxID=393087 RepID=UPI00037E2A31|nr:hypothetical protein [Gracilibacillus lacisalsi]
MKKLFIYIAVVSFIAGCSNLDEDMVTDETNTEAEEEPVESSTKTAKEVEVTEELDDSESKATVGSSDKSQSSEVPDLKLQVTKVDEEQGITIENNEMYSQLNEVIKADPKAGFPNDFSVYPRDLVYNEDGGISILFLGVNRLDAPIQSIYFQLTLGKQNDNYIFENKPVTLHEEEFGKIETDSAVPFLLDVNPEDEEIFMDLTEENIDIRLDHTEVELED